MGFTKRVVLPVLALSFLAAVVAGCGKGGRTPGENLDRALDKTGEKIKDAGEAIQPK
jgi:hypothetical protein